LLTIVI